MCLIIIIIIIIIIIPGCAPEHVNDTLREYKNAPKSATYTVPDRAPVKNSLLARSAQTHTQIYNDRRILTEGRSYVETTGKDLHLLFCST